MPEEKTNVAPEDKWYETEGESTDEAVKETSQDPSSETKTDETEKPSEEGEKPKEEAPEEDNTPPEDTQVPFNKHPRFRQIIDENRALKERIETIARQQEEVLSRVKSNESETKTDIPPEFVELYGDNPETYQKWLKLEERKAQEFAQRQADTQAEFERQQRETAKQSEEYVNSEIESLLSEKLVEDRNSFMKFLLDYQTRFGAKDVDGNDIVVLPEDGRGNIDFRRCVDLYNDFNSASKEVKAAKAQARKAIAPEETSSSSTSEPKAQEYVTAAEARRMRW